MLRDITKVEIDCLKVAMDATTAPVTFEKVVAQDGDLRKALNRMKAFGMIVTSNNYLSNKGLAYLIAYGNMSFYDVYQKHKSDFDSKSSADFMSTFERLDKNVEWFDLFYRAYMFYHIENELFNSRQSYAFRVPITDNEAKRFRVEIIKRVAMYDKIPIPTLAGTLGAAIKEKAIEANFTKDQFINRLKELNY